MEGNKSPKNVPDTDIDLDPLVEDRTVVYDQLESKPYVLLRDELADFISETVESAGRDAADVEKVLTNPPLDEDWWFETGTGRTLKAIIVSNGDSLVRIDVSYELGADPALSEPSPDALPILDDDSNITLTFIVKEESTFESDIETISLRTVTEEKGEEGEIEKSPPPEPPDADVYHIELLGPDDQELNVEVDPDKSAGFLTTHIKPEYEIYDADAEIGLYADDTRTSEIKDTDDLEPYNNETVYWEIE